MFRKVFQYELNNRAFAYGSVSDLAKKKENSEQGEFWAAFWRLEQQNRPRYEEMAAKYGLEVNTLVVRLKDIAMDIGFSLMPRRTMQLMTDATLTYVHKLRVLPELAREEDRPFFEYVIAQEQAQADAMVHANRGDYAQAARVLREFVERTGTGNDNH